MGVLGLTPFLQKKVPQVIREIPQRLAGLKDKTVVIDGTLITQRLHYSPLPHEYRHVLGWYRIIRQLQKNGVGVICVFDGPERVLAKMRETERRRAVRQLTLARETIEVERVARLDQLSKLVQIFHTLPNNERADALRELKTHWTEAPSPSVTPIAQLPPSDAHRIELAPRWTYQRPIILHRWVSPYASLGPAPSSPTGVPPEDTAPRIPYRRPSIVHRWVPPYLSTAYIEAAPVPNALDYSNIEEAASYDDIMRDDDFIGMDFASVDQRDLLYDGVEEEFPDTKAFAWDLEELGLPKDELEALISDMDLDRARRLPVADESSVSQSLLKLHADYLRSVPKFRVPARFEQEHDASSPAESEHAMSHFQYELMLEEGALWDALTEPDAPDTAHGLHVRSAAIAASYAKRNAAPSKATYKESQQMLHALGVPCLSCDGPHEGEAFAAALVHAGTADYVASEDTDVLVYEAPLLRGLTNLRSPLTVISGAEVREALELSRPSFVDFALLLGTDFSRRLHGLGPMRAITLIREHGSIEGVLAARAELLGDAEREEYLQQVELARAVFNSLPEVSPSIFSPPREPDEGLVRELLKAYGLEHAVAGDDYGDEPSGNVGFGAEFWIESGFGEAAPNIGANLFQDKPDTAASAIARA